MTACPKSGPHAAARVAPNCRHCTARPLCPLSRLHGDQVVELQLQEHSFGVGDVLQAQGGTSTAIRIIKSGATMVCRDAPAGGRQPVGIAGRGTLTGQFGLLGRVDLVTHIAILEGRYCELSNAALQRSGLLETPAFMGQMFDVLAHSIEAHFNWSHLRNGDGVVRQLAGALLYLSNLQGSLRVRLPTQTTLADLLGTTRESITRAFARLEKDGSLSRCGRYYCDLQVPRLVQAIEMAP